MNGLMMHCNLNITSIMRHAMTVHADQEIVSLKSDGVSIHRYTYQDAFKRVAQFAHALDQLNISADAKVGTLAWNTYQHMELHYAIPCTGRIYHTINPKLQPEQIKQIIMNACDEVLLIEPENIPLLNRFYSDFKGFLKYIIVLGDIQPELIAEFPFQFYETLIQQQPEHYDWLDIPEQQASGLCYTSGTTGQPKGVLYSHRSTTLHALIMSMVDVVGLHRNSVMMPMVPLYHISAWDMPFNAILCGAKLVWPNQFAGQAEKMVQLMQSEYVDISMAVPTVWTAIKEYLYGHKQSGFSLKRAISGGSAAPLALIKSMQELGIQLENGWGMTETSSLGAINRTPSEIEDFDGQAIKCGRPVFGMQMQLRHLDGHVLPHDGAQEGVLEIRGHTVVQSYMNDQMNDQKNRQLLTRQPETFMKAIEPQWFDTGDIATIDQQGYMHITDRAKDMIKSGGEWISSVEVENAAMGHSKVHEAAVIGVAHPKWGERPLLIIVAKENQNICHEEMVKYLSVQLHKWALPSATLVVKDIPHTPTGKISKKQLREQYQDFFQQLNAV